MLQTPATPTSQVTSIDRPVTDPVATEQLHASASGLLDLSKASKAKIDSFYATAIEFMDQANDFMTWAEGLNRGCAGAA